MIIEKYNIKLAPSVFVFEKHEDEEGNIHNEKGPAIIWENKVETWAVHGWVHCDTGPAVRCPNNLNDRWFIHGCEITDEVNKWIIKNNIPDWKDWNQEQIESFRKEFC